MVQLPDGDNIHLVATECAKKKMRKKRNERSTAAEAEVENNYAMRQYLHDNFFMSCCYHQ